MTERVKLPNPGDELVLSQVAVATDTIGNTDYILFSNAVVELAVPAASVKRQLDRLKVAAIPELAGKTIKFSRSTGLNKFNLPYWNLDLAEPPTGAPPVPKKDEKRPVSYGTPGFLDGAEEQDAAELAAKIAPDEAAVMLQSYLDLTAWVLKRLPKIYEEAKIGMSPESAAACTHTLFIEANRRRLIGRVK